MNQAVRKHSRIALVVVMAAAIAMTMASSQATAYGQQRPRRGGSSPASDINALFFTARLIVANAAAIGLTDPQRTEIQAAAREAQQTYRQTRFELDNAMTVLAGMATQHPADEAQLLEQLDRILELESQIKRGQLVTLVRTKNALTPDQHARLRELKGRQSARQPPAP